MDGKSRDFHTFSLAPVGVWVRLLRDNGGVARPYWGKLARILLASTMATPLRWVEGLRWGRQVAQTPIAQPEVIILGFARTGTTHLHNLLAHDPKPRGRHHAAGGDADLLAD